MRIERQNEGVPEVVLDHPPVNALRTEDFLALADAVSMLGRDPATRVVILRSDVEKAFAAGVDVNEMTEGGPRAVVAVTRACAEAYGAIAECEVPVIAAVHGYCLATGVGLAGNADVIVASDDAVFGLPEVDRGGLGTATQLRSLVPPHKARWLAYSCAPHLGRRVGALRNRRARRAARRAARLRPRDRWQHRGEEPAW